jgi:hypothetical protein
LAKGVPRQTEQETTPQEFAEAPPRDIYPVSDIRFVLVEIGKLATKTDRLIDDVKGHGDKIDAVRHQASFVKGALYVIGAVIAVLGIAVVWYFSGKLAITIKPGA